MRIEQFLPRFKLLIKNRKSPFKICIKNSVAGYYTTTDNNATFEYPWQWNKSKAFDYITHGYGSEWIRDRLKYRASPNFCRPGEICSIVLVNAGEDIELKDSDWM